jgi:transposase
MDVHQDLIVLAGVGKEGKLLFERRVRNKGEMFRRKIDRLRESYDLRCCYEASSCGYVVYRWLTDLGVSCKVIAPSLLPRFAGDRIKTDRRDALKLALSYQAGILTTVYVPGEAEEGVRSLIRCREALRGDVTRLRHRVLKFLQRKGMVYDNGRNWTDRHWKYLRRLEFTGEDEIVYREYLELLDYHLARVRGLDQKIQGVADSSRYRHQVSRLRCLRGIDTLTAMILISEVIDFRRFANAPALMGYVGLVPSQYSSGQTTKMGSITKTGNGRCRWALIESAWHYRHKPAVGARLKKAWEGQPAELTAVAWHAQQRLYKKFWRIAYRTGNNNKAVVATARELVGFVWALMTSN